MKKKKKIVFKFEIINLVRFGFRVITNLPLENTLILFDQII